MQSVIIIKHEIEKRFNFAEFDARIFQLPSKIEVENYLIWRQKDTTRNSISSVAQSLYIQKELNGKNQEMMQELIFQKGINWNDYDAKLKRGRMIVKEQYIKVEVPLSMRTRWISVAPPILTQDKEYSQLLIPSNF